MTNAETRMTNQTTMTNDQPPAGQAPGRRRVPSALPFRHSLVIRISVLVILAAQAAGCGNLFHTTPSKPQLYRIQGRVLDGLTRQGLGKARVLLKATISTQLNTQALAAAGSPDAQGGGVVQLSNYAVTDENGAYTMELSEGFEIVRAAARIRLEAALPGYAAAGIDLPPPTKDEPVHKVPDLFLARGSLAPASTLPRGVIVPGVPSAPNTGAPVRVVPPPIGPRPKKPQPSAIPWK
jgi:hypothetical protein